MRRCSGLAFGPRVSRRKRLSLGEAAERMQQKMGQKLKKVASKREQTDLKKEDGGKEEEDKILIQKSTVLKILIEVGLLRAGW